LLRGHHRSFARGVDRRAIGRALRMTDKGKKAKPPPSTPRRSCGPPLRSKARGYTCRPNSEGFQRPDRFTLTVEQIFDRVILVHR
jgi:hypothetical protein